jgi:hypothetical protein
MRLFGRMRRSEQLHSLRVMATLRERGHAEPDLLAAALLHDCGKSRYPLSLAGRTLAVLIHALAPGAYRRWSAGAPRGWRRPLVIAAQHPGWLAEDMLAAGAPARAAGLARRHQTSPGDPPATDEDRLLAALQAADRDQ